MEDLIKQVDELLTQYLREELGNRMSQFSMKGFRMTLVEMIANYKPKEKEVKKEDVKK